MRLRQPTRLLDKSNPSPSSSPLLRGERRQDHPRELILILSDFQMMSLAARTTRLWTTGHRKRSGNRRAARESRECTRIETGTSAQFRGALEMRLAVASRFGSNPARERKAMRGRPALRSLLRRSGCEGWKHFVRNSFLHSRSFA